MALAPTGPASAEDQLHDLIATYYDDPLGFVLNAYPWPIHGEDGPDAWQREELTKLGEAVRARAFDGVDPVLPIRKAISSGNGVGKTAFIAWIADWIMSTRRNCHGTVTANTMDQLEKKTWAAIREWTALCITSHWFEINSQIMYRVGHRESWFCAPLSCSPENADAYRGQHAKSSTSFYLLDEASGIKTPIFVAMEGGLTDGEPMVLLTGNMTRNTGEFHNAVFGKQRDRWSARVIDSRTAKFHSPALIQQWLDDYGEDSDFFRVNVRGLPPVASEFQFIDTQRIVAAQQREVWAPYDEPLIAGVDVSGGGDAWTVMRLRRGADARFPAVRISGEETRDRQRVISVLAERLRDASPEKKIAAMFIDAAFGSPIVERLRQMGFTQVFEISFGSTSGDIHFANQRAMMWGKLKDWLLKGGIDAADERLATDLGAPGFHLNKKDQLVLESKESMAGRGVHSPDDADALCLTWAMPVALPESVQSAVQRQARYSPPSEWH